MWDLSSPTRNRTRIPCIGRWILKHWTTREVPVCFSNDWLVVRQQAVLQELCSASSYHPPPGWGLSSCRRTQRYCYIYSLRRNQDPAPRLHYCFLTVPPLFLHPLPSLISNCLNLPFGTQAQIGFVPGSPTGSCLVSD